MSKIFIFKICLIMLVFIRPFFFTMPYHLWDLCFLTWDETWAPAVEVWRPNHWTTREVPS